MDDHMNQPYEVRIDTIFGEHVETIHEKTINSYDSAGKPKNLGKQNVKSLTRSNWLIGLYKQTITFTEYAKHTDDAISEIFLRIRKLFARQTKRVRNYVGC